jgi:hypothetical protein
MPKVDVNGYQVTEAFVVTAEIVVSDEPLDVSIKIFRQEIVIQQDTVLDSLMTTKAGLVLRTRALSRR